MANGETATVTMRSPGGKTYSVPRENEARAKLLGWTEITVEKKGAAAGPGLWEAANTPIGSRPGGLFGSKGLPPGGIPEELRTEIINFLSKQQNLSPETRRKLFYALDVPGELLSSIPEAGRRMMTPLGISTMGAGGMLEQLRDVTGVPEALKTAVGAAETGTGAGFGAAGAEQSLTARKKNESLEDYLERVISGAGQALFGAAGVSHALGPSAEAGARSTLRGVSDRSRSAVESAERQHGREAQAKQEKFESEARQGLAKSRGEYESGEAERQAEIARKTEKHRADVESAKLKYQAELEAYEQAISGRVTKEAHARLKNERLERARTQLNQSREQASKDLAANLDKAESTERAQLDERYKNFDRQVLGVSEANPNGTLQSQLDPLAAAVENAKKNILKGSATNIPIFNSILGRIKEWIELPTGEAKPVEGQTIPTAQLRGYVRELGDAIYDHENVPGDVRQAIKSVEEAAKKEVRESINDVHGESATKLFDDLSNDWSNYKRVWFDRSRVNPLANMRRIFRDPSVEKSGLSVSDALAKQVAGEKGRNIVKLLAEKSRYGADPRIAARVMALDEKIGGLDSLFEKVPVAKYPRVPKQAEVEPPKLPEEPTSTRVDIPKPPSTEPFNRGEFIREGVEKRMRQAGNWGSLLGIGSSIYDLVRGEPGAAMRMGEKVAMIQALKELLARPGTLRWVSGEGPSRELWRGFGGPRGSAETPTPAAPSSPPSPGFKGGISAKGTEEAMRGTSVDEMVQALFVEQDVLRERLRKAPPSPERDQLILRMAQTLEMIKDLREGGKP